MNSINLSYIKGKNLLNQINDKSYSTHVFEFIIQLIFIIIAFIVLERKRKLLLFLLYGLILGYLSYTDWSNEIFVAYSISSLIFLFELLIKYNNKQSENLKFYKLPLYGIISYYMVKIIKN